MKTFGQNLSELITQRRVKLKELAAALGIPLKTIHEWTGARGRMPRSPEHIRKLAAYFGVSTHFLLFGEEDPRNLVQNLLEKTEIHTGTYEITVKRITSTSD